MSIEYIIFGVVAVGILIVVIALSRHVTARRSKHIQTVTCPNCGWVGHVSRYAGRCPECNTHVGDELAHK